VEIKDELNKKTLKIPDPSLYFKVFDGTDALKLIIEIIKVNCNSASNLNKIRGYLLNGLSLKEIYTVRDNDNE